MFCKYCESKYTYYDRTNASSPNTALVSLRDKIILTADERKRYEIPAKFCPVCGKAFSAQKRNTEQNYSNIIRNNIKEEMDMEHISITQLSKMTGIAKSTLSDFLSCTIECLSADKIGLIAEALKLPVERLFLPRAVGLTYEEGLMY